MNRPQWSNLLVALALVISGCVGFVPYPREPEYDNVAGVESTVAMLLEQKATAQQVVESFGEARAYTRSTMLYWRSRDSSVGYIFWVLASGGGVGGGTFGPSRYELILNFNDKEQLVEYQFRELKSAEKVEIDYATLRKKAKAGDSESQWELYVVTGVIDWNVAWLCSSADQGHPEAQRRVAFLYRNGWYSLDPDPLKAHMWFTLSAESGNELSVVDATKIWNTLSAKEKSEAKEMLSKWQPGLCQTDLPQSRSPGTVDGLSYQEWLEKASQVDADPEAQLLVWWLTDESGFEKYKWLCRAADQGLVKSRNRLGIIYEQGADGLKKNRILAYMWYTLSAQNDPWADEQASRLRDDMSRREISDAEVLLQNWEPGQCEQHLLTLY